MRILHVVKTADGAGWAALQAGELVKLGVDVHVALPCIQGRTVQQWEAAGAIIHVVPIDLPTRSPWLLPSRMRAVCDLVGHVRPDLIHSHFFGSTVLLRLALGADHPTPRVFQVPGPLHLEHGFWRRAELSTAGPRDSWIASSRCILGHYRTAGVSEDRLYLSYYGLPDRKYPTASAGALRERFGIPAHFKLVGNVNFIYPPKWYLGQRVGLKAHEDVIDALGLVIRQRSDVMGVLIGGTFAGSQWYERRLQTRASTVGNGRIMMTGYVPAVEIPRMWADFDVAVHVPTSENCGGVVEPLLAGVPVIAGRVGGLPEVVVEGHTGTLVEIRNPEVLAEAITDVLAEPDHHRGMARAGRGLVEAMFDVRKTAAEVLAIYRHVLDDRHPPPTPFSSEAYLRERNIAVATGEDGRGNRANA